MQIVMTITSLQLDRRYCQLRLGELNNLSHRVAWFALSLKYQRYKRIISRT